MNTTGDKKMTMQAEMFPIFAVEPGATVECFTGKRRAIVIELYEANIDGRIPALVVNLETGENMIPFVDECRVTKPAIHRGLKHEMSQETAERFAAYARAK